VRVVGVCRTLPASAGWCLSTTFPASLRLWKQLAFFEGIPFPFLTERTSRRNNSQWVSRRMLSELVCCTCTAHLAQGQSPHRSNRYLHSILVLSASILLMHAFPEGKDPS